MIKVGFARRDITPQWSVPLAGYGNTSMRMSENVLDPLTTTCTVFTDDAGRSLVLISNDLIKTSLDLANEIRDMICNTFGIPRTHIMVCNTHTHCGPDMLNREHEAIVQYRPVLVLEIQKAVGEALIDRKPAEFFIGRSNPVGLNWCRHYINSSDGASFIAHRKGPDNQLQLVKITREGGKDIIMMNWQGHPCYYDGAKKTDISADYIHAVRALTEEETGANFVYFQGAAGDLTVRSRVKALRLAGDTYDYAKKMVPEILSVLENLTPVTPGPIRAAEKTVQLEVDHTDDHMLEDARKIIFYHEDHNDLPGAKAMGEPYGIHSYYHACGISRRSKMGDHEEMTIFAASVGELGFAFAPYEMFHSNGAYVKNNSPFEATFMVGYTNAGHPYVADEHAFEYGCYEVDARHFVRGTGEKLAESFVELLEDLRADTPINTISLDTISGSLSYAMGIEPPKFAAAPNEPMVKYIDDVLQGKKADRILMYNPDAVAQWIYEKYPYYTQEVVRMTDLELPLCAVYPPVTPVCFGTMYTGAQPEVHGIQKYDKPVLKIDTFFDALIRAGKKPLIIASQNCSIAKIFLERDMDYIITKGMDETNAAAVKAILEDKHDFILVYNGNYDARMHRNGPEAPETLAELRTNSCTFAMLTQLVKTHWKHHNTLMGFAMDHGCHWVKPFVSNGGKLTYGSHGEYIPEDINIVHRYQIYPATE